MNTKDTIYTASLLNDIVYYIYFSYGNNVWFFWTLVLNGHYILAEGDSNLPLGLDMLIKLYYMVTSCSALQDGYFSVVRSFLPWSDWNS